jgi:hypothetical protein
MKSAANRAAAEACAQMVAITVMLGDRGLHFLFPLSIG